MGRIVCHQEWERIERMDQLVAYDSDSENENEDHANSSDFDKPTLEVGEKSNFFGLVGATCEVVTCDGKEKDQLCAARYLSVQGASVQVPEGDFWTTLSQAEICSRDCKDDGVRPEKRKLDSTVKSPSVGDKTARLYCSSAKRRQHGGGSLVHQGTRWSSQQCSTTTSVDSASRKALTGKSCSLQPDGKVKVYEVHPAISPHLNRQQSSRCAAKVSGQWTGHTGAVNRLAWCSDPAFSHLLVSASMDTTIRVWNAWGQCQACVRTLTCHTKAVRDVHWSMDGRQVLSCSYDRTAAVTDVETGQCRVRLEHSSFVSTGKFHPVTPHLVTTGTKDCIQVWDRRDPQVPVRILAHKEHLGQVQDLMFSRDGHELFSCGDVVSRESTDRSIMAWDFDTGVILSNQIFQERYTVTRLCLHPRQSQFVGQTQAGYIAIFSTQRPYKMNKNKRFEGHQTASYSIGVSLSQDGNVVYSGSSDGSLHCYSFHTGRKIRTLACGDTVVDVAAHPVLPSCVAGGTWGGDIVLFQ